MLPSTAPATGAPAFRRLWSPRLPDLAARVRRGLAHAWKWLTWPTPPAPVFHITHYKAGSQWMRRILEELAGPWVMAPRFDGSQFLTDSIHPRRVYPTLYVTRDEFQRVRVPADSRRFIVIRDLRDTLVSAYFSLRVSHNTAHSHVGKYREMLKSIPPEEALARMIRSWCPQVAAIQDSWIAAGEEVIKYEEMLVRDEEILRHLLLDQCRLPVSRERFVEVVRANRFEARSGRRRGEENIGSHERKGIAGDWRNHFTDRLAKEFKTRYGQLLITAGYEDDDRW